MSEKNINITPNINQITVNNPDTGVTVNPDPELTTVIVQSDQTKVLEVQTPGPQGPRGPVGPAGPSGSAEASGPDKAIQFNDGGSTVSGSSLFLFDKTTGAVTLSGSFLVSGSLLPNADSSYTSSFSLGSATNAWKDLYVGDSTIYFVSESITHPLTIITNDDGLVTLTIDGRELPLAGVTGSQNITASFAVSASVAEYSTTASYALNALNTFSNLIYSGSITASVDISNDIFLIKSASVEMFKVNNEGVTILKTSNTTPSAVAGGIFYSGSGDFFFGS